MLLIQNNNLMVQRRFLLLDQRSPLWPEVREDTSTSWNQVQTIVSITLEVPLFAIPGVIPALPKCNADCFPSAHRARTGTDISNTSITHKRRHELIKTAGSHVV